MRIPDKLKLRKVKSGIPYNPANENAFEGSTKNLEPVVVQKSETVLEEPKKKYAPSTETKDYDYTFKLILLGDGGVGKTTLFQRYITNKFIEGTQMTIGVNFKTKVVKGVEAFDGNKYDVNIQLWDIGGQKQFEPIRPVFYRGAVGALLVYDVTRYETLDNLDNWLNEVNKALESAKVPMIVLGNKVDAIEDRIVEREHAEAFSKKRGFQYLETSAKTGENVEKAFADICKEMINKTLGA